MVEVRNCDCGRWEIGRVGILNEEFGRKELSMGVGNWMEGTYMLGD